MNNNKGKISDAEALKFIQRQQNDTQEPDFKIAESKKPKQKAIKEPKEPKEPKAPKQPKQNKQAQSNCIELRKQITHLKRSCSDIPEIKTMAIGNIHSMDEDQLTSLFVDMKRTAMSGGTSAGVLVVPYGIALKVAEKKIGNLDGLHDACLGDSEEATAIKRTLKFIECEYLYNFGQLDNPFLRLALLTGKVGTQVFNQNKGISKVYDQNTKNEMLQEIAQQAQPTKSPEEFIKAFTTNEPATEQVKEFNCMSIVEVQQSGKTMGELASEGIIITDDSANDKV